MTLAPPTRAADRHLYQRPDLSGTGISYLDQSVAHHGPDRDFVYPDRAVAVVPGRTWPATRPEDCDHTGGGEWFREGALLLCPGCGLDCT
jgi:hypothetical protein